MIGLIFQALTVFGPMIARRMEIKTRSSAASVQPAQIGKVIDMVTAGESYLHNIGDLSDYHKEHPAIVAARNRRAKARAERDDARQKAIEKKLRGDG